MSILVYCKSTGRKTAQGEGEAASGDGDDEFEYCSAQFIAFKVTYVTSLIFLAFKVFEPDVLLRTEGCLVCCSSPLVPAVTKVPCQTAAMGLLLRLLFICVKCSRHPSLSS